MVLSVVMELVGARAIVDMLVKRFVGGLLFVLLFIKMLVTPTGTRGRGGVCSCGGVNGGCVIDVGGRARVIGTLGTFYGRGKVLSNSVGKVNTVKRLALHFFGPGAGTCSSGAFQRRVRVSGLAKGVSSVGRRMCLRLRVAINEDSCSTLTKRLLSTVRGNTKRFIIRSCDRQVDHACGPSLKLGVCSFRE